MWGPGEQDALKRLKKFRKWKEEWLSLGMGLWIGCLLSVVMNLFLYTMVQL